MTNQRSDVNVSSWVDELPLAGDAGERRGDMLFRPLGRAGERVSLLGMGGFHLGKSALSDAESVKLIHQAIDRGITFLDNCWDYNEGRSELRVGVALSQSGYRQKAFLMTKIDGRTKAEAKRQLDMSLQRLRTDCIDLVQHHEVIRFEDADRIFAEGGAAEALAEAKRDGKIRYVGFTGHKHPAIHAHTLDVAAAHGYPFDTVQMPINVMDAHFRSFARGVLPRLVEEGVAPLAMKTFGDSVLLKSGAAITPVEMLHYGMTLATSVVITGIETKRDLDQALEAARTFTPLSRDALVDLLTRSAPHAAQGRYELFKTSTKFDGTALSPEWLGAASDAVESLAPEMK
jgi:aryl-alcohol dehydrogenase-like predicted oxidoreductase